MYYARTSVLILNPFNPDRSLIRIEFGYPHPIIFERMEIRMKIRMMIRMKNHFFFIFRIYWLRVRAKIFPTLSQIARKYLGIPATSVSSKRLFSHASNLISVKRTRLYTSLAGQMLFSKRNICLMEVFPKEWGEIEK